MPRPKGALRKSDRTRANILAAARELFATDGYERTTIRKIAARAQIDPAMVIRYFGGKEDLFARAGEPDLGLPNLGKIEPDAIGETLIRHFLKIWEDEPGDRGLPVLLRSAASNPQAAERLRHAFARQVMPAIARAGNPATAPQRAGLVATQMLGLAFCRYVLNLPEVRAIPTETIIREVGATIERYATGIPVR